MNDHESGWDKLLRDLARETPAQAWLRQAAAKLREIEGQETARRDMRSGI